MNLEKTVQILKDLDSEYIFLQNDKINILPEGYKALQTACNCVNLCSKIIDVIHDTSAMDNSQRLYKEYILDTIYKMVTKNCN